MKIEDAIAIQRKLMTGTQAQFDKEQDAGKKLALHKRIQSIYVAIACMTVMEGKGLEDKLDAAGIAGPGDAATA